MQTVGLYMITFFEFPFQVFYKEVWTSKYCLYKSWKNYVSNKKGLRAPEMKFFSIRMSIRSLPSIRKIYRLVSAVSQVYQRFTQGSPKKILQSTKLVRVYCGSIPISLRDLRSILNDVLKSTKCILNLRDIPNSLRSLQSIPNDLSEYTKTIRKVYYSIRFHGIFD